MQNYFNISFILSCFLCSVSLSSPIDLSLSPLLPSESTQLEDPRAQWQREQEVMLREYLDVAKDSLSAQKEIYQVKEQRLRLAQQEYRQLNDAWRDKSTSQTSCKDKPGGQVYGVAEGTGVQVATVMRGREARNLEGLYVNRGQGTKEIRRQKRTTVIGSLLLLFCVMQHF